MNDEQRKPTEEERKEEIHPHKFVGSGFLLFAGTLAVSIGGWLYWLVISRLTTPSEIGDATSIYSLAVLAGTLAQLGLEYPLLKRSYDNRSKILGTALIIELTIALAFLPVVYLVIENFYDQGLREFYFLAAILIIFSAISFVARYALLGLSDARTILILDVVSTIVKFTAGFLLVSIGLGAFGILLSFALQTLALAVGALIVARKSFALSFGGIKFSRQIIIEGLVNLPSKASSVLIINLSVVLLASFGVSSSEIGIFYIITMISVAIGAFAVNTALMSIPASSMSNRDLSRSSERIGLVFTAPIIVVLIVVPEVVLSVIGEEYVGGKIELVILAIGIFPLIIVRNAISKFNNKDEKTKLLVFGSSLSGSFIVFFLLLVPAYGISGAAYSITLSFVLPAILSIIWSERKSLRFVAFTGLSIVAGISSGIVVNYALNLWILSTVVALASTITIILALRCTSVKEISTMIKGIRS